MTKEAIIEEIKKHSPEEQREIFEAVLEPIKKDDELTPEDIAVADARWQEMEEHPERTMTLKELKHSVQQLTKKNDVSA
ncbi:MAG: hypothetical protein R6V86_01595 [Spirochaetia bacterium]